MSSSAPTPTKRFSRPKASKAQWLVNGPDKQFATSTRARRLSRFEEEVRAKLDEHAPTEEGNSRMERCIQSLEAIMKQLGPRWRLSPFGSAANGFITKGSDLDATCYEVLDVNDGEEQNADEDRSPKAASQPADILGERLVPLLQQHLSFSITQAVLNARVPIIKLRFEDSLEVDLSCNNTTPLHNTRLLHAYSSLDPRVRELGVAVKLWAREAHVCGAFQAHLSSYSFVIMVLYFLQVAPKIKFQVAPKINLPMLPAQSFLEETSADADERLSGARAGWTCTLTTGQLLIRFFEFYAQEFFWGSEVVSLRFGSRLDVRSPFFASLKGRHFPRLHVEDPCDPSRNLNCVLGETEEVMLHEEFQKACMMVQRDRTPFGVRISLFQDLEQMSPETERLEAVAGYVTAAAEGSTCTFLADPKTRSLSEGAESTDSTASYPDSGAWSTASTIDDRGSCNSGDDDSSGVETQMSHPLWTVAEGTKASESYTDKPCVTGGELGASLLALVKKDVHPQQEWGRQQNNHDFLTACASGQQGGATPEVILSAILGHVPKVQAVGRCPVEMDLSSKLHFSTEATLAQPTTRPRKMGIATQAIFAKLAKQCDHAARY
jgi:DNA polymerase sigma